MMLPITALQVKSIRIAGWRHRIVTLLYLALALLGVALAWVGGLCRAVRWPLLCALLLWWGVGRAEAAARPPLP